MIDCKLIAKTEFTYWPEIAELKQWSEKFVYEHLDSAPMNSETCNIARSLVVSVQVVSRIGERTTQSKRIISMLLLLLLNAGYHRWDVMPINAATRSKAVTRRPHLLLRSVTRPTHDVAPSVRPSVCPLVLRRVELVWQTELLKSVSVISWTRQLWKPGARFTKYLAISS